MINRTILLCLLLPASLSAQTGHKRNSFFIETALVRSFTYVKGGEGTVLGTNLLHPKYALGILLERQFDYKIALDVQEVWIDQRIRLPGTQSSRPIPYGSSTGLGRLSLSVGVSRAIHHTPSGNFILRPWAECLVSAYKDYLSARRFDNSQLLVTEVFNPDSTLLLTVEEKRRATTPVGVSLGVGLQLEVRVFKSLYLGLRPTYIQGLHWAVEAHGRYEQPGSPVTTYMARSRGSYYGMIFSIRAYFKKRPQKP